MAVPQTGGKVAVSAEQLGGLLKSLEGTQRHRAEEYSRLNASFQQLLKDRDELKYRRALATSTASFQESSSDFRAAISLLERSGEHREVCTLLQDMQKREQAKLKFTLILQALRAAGAERRFSWQQPGSEIGADLEDGQHGSDGIASACGCDASKAKEPTEEDFNGAMEEATRELQTAVEDINGILEELQYVKEDL